MSTMQRSAEASGCRCAGQGPPETQAPESCHPVEPEAGSVVRPRCSAGPCSPWEQRKRCHGRPHSSWRYSRQQRRGSDSTPPQRERCAGKRSRSVGSIHYWNSEVKDKKKGAQRRTVHRDLHSTMSRLGRMSHHQYAVYVPGILTRGFAAHCPRRACCRSNGPPRLAAHQKVQEAAREEGTKNLLHLKARHRRLVEQRGFVQRASESHRTVGAHRRKHRWKADGFKQDPRLTHDRIP